MLLEHAIEEPEPASSHAESSSGSGSQQPDYSYYTGTSSYLPIPNYVPLFRTTTGLTDTFTNGFTLSRQPSHRSLGSHVFSDTASIVSTDNTKKPPKKSNTTAIENITVTTQVIERGKKEVNPYGAGIFTIKASLKNMLNLTDAQKVILEPQVKRSVFYFLSCLSTDVGEFYVNCSVSRRRFLTNTLFNTIVNDTVIDLHVPDGSTETARNITVDQMNVLNHFCTEITPVMGRQPVTEATTKKSYSISSLVILYSSEYSRFDGVDLEFICRRKPHDVDPCGDCTQRGLLDTATSGH
ncbi:hypothetical protein BDB01DRAFT_846257 [Pilobolus umbonatus]|nr:hypothetical protein BDB01DRAFT_846257 [Pilobolus umbonatus]